MIITNRFDMWRGDGGFLTGNFVSEYKTYKLYSDVFFFSTYKYVFRHETSLPIQTHTVDLSRDK